MAFRIVWTASASEDLKEIVQFIALDNRDAAIRLAHKIFEHIEHAAQMPQANRIVPEKEDQSIREAILKPYRIIYHLDMDQQSITILRIWHGFRGEPQV